MCANDPQAPVSQGWRRASHRKIEPAKSTSYCPCHPHDDIAKLRPDEVYEVDAEIWPTSIVCPKGYRLGLTIGGKNFERPEATGLMRGSGLFLRIDQGDRPSGEWGGTNRIHMGAEHQSYLLMPRIPLDERPVSKRPLQKLDAQNSTNVLFGWDITGKKDRRKTAACCRDA